MLPTDLRSPVRATLARIPDRRAMQFWDPQHLVAKELNRIAAEKPPKPDCCFDQGFYWDDAILYPPHSQWKQPPVPVFWNGQVIRVSAALEQALQNLH